MQLRKLALVLAGSALVAASSWLVATHLAVHEARADEGGPAVPVLVELFTSEGCSSCPPAEAELLRLDRDQPVAGARIIPIGFHVDYWDNLGWADPFSSPAWTQRQADYDRSRGGQVYTPQAVVQGADECLGSSDSQLQSVIRQAAYPHTPRASVSITRTAPASGGATVRVSVAVAGMPAVSASDTAEVRVVLVEHDVVVDVARGENSGKRLAHAPLARDLVTAGVVAGAGGTFDATLTIPAASHRDKLAAVAIVQERSSHRVLGVEMLAL